MNPELEKQLMNKIRKADKFIFWCILTLLFLVVLLFAIIILQNQQNAENSRLQALDNHKRTQGLIICVAETLRKPVAERGDLDDCVVDAQNRTKEAE